MQRRGRPRKLSGNNLAILAVKEEMFSDESPICSDRKKKKQKIVVPI